MKPDFEKMSLIPAIVQDYHTKEVLMMAYVNEEAYNTMIETNMTCFYSRSRNSLWKKGETSGHVQYIKGMYLDCDCDTLLIYVEQIGVACHTGAMSCFFNAIQDYKPLGILEEIEATIQDRKIHPVENSYTNYLLDKGIDKTCKKVGEEATETVIAAKNNDKEELIGEVGDLFYHVLVLMNQSDITLSDVENTLAKRHLKSGNKKTENSKGDY